MYLSISSTLILILHTSLCCTMYVYVRINAVGCRFMGDRHYNGPLLLAQELCQFALTEPWSRSTSTFTCIYM